MKKLVLLDGHAIIHRAFHAIQPLHTAGGELVNAVFGFTSMLFNVLEIEKPDYLAVAFDKKGPTFRHQADENYKATRAKCPDELISQVKRIYEIARAFSVPIFAQSGFEADDMLGTICKKSADESDLQTIVVSSDRDMLQLVTERISVHDLTGGYRKSISFTPAVVQEKYGFEPKLIPDYKGLMGDASDNLKGVSGIGPKTATELIQNFGPLEKIYEHLAEIKDSVRAKLEQDRESAFHSKKMATIRCDVPVDWNLANCQLNDFDREAVIQLFQELEFQSLEKRFERLFALKQEKPAVEQPKQQSLF